tara:strand:+ start:708 stop:1454 length:747 start_codon:yes stop_codon:yes gene_type:complete
LIVSLSLICLILFKDEELEDLNLQIELKTSDSNTYKIISDNKHSVPESENKIKAKSSKEILNDNDNDLIEGEDFDEVDLYEELPDNFKLYKKPFINLPKTAIPTKIVISEIGLNSKVSDLEIIDLGSSASYETPKNIVGHIPESVNPGGIGKSWYFGHLESFIRKEGNVFHMLPKIPELLKQNPSLFVHISTDKKTYVYQIYKTEVIPKEELYLDLKSDIPEAILVTCVPSFLYHSRLLVYSKLVGTY